MITDQEKITELVIDTLHKYQQAINARRSLNHKSVFEYCQKAINNIALATYLIVEEKLPTITEAINWVKELPIPNGLYPMLIEAVDQLAEKYFPLLNFALSYPTSSKNIFLVKDALQELYNNIEKNDDEELFSEALENWRVSL